MFQKTEKRQFKQKLKRNLDKMMKNYFFCYYM